MNKTGYATILPRMIDGVIFGLLTDSACERQIRQWVHERSAPTELLRVEHVKDSFELKTVRAD
jgi:hypothetical protein